MAKGRIQAMDPADAIIDALSPLGINDMEMPATSERVWRAINAARTS